MDLPSGSSNGVHGSKTVHGTVFGRPEEPSTAGYVKTLSRAKAIRMRAHGVSSIVCLGMLRSGVPATEKPLPSSRINYIPHSRWPKGIPPVMGAHLMPSGAVAPVSTSKGLSSATLCFLE